MKKGFDSEKYLEQQSEYIIERAGQFENKLYLEFGGKLVFDYHASRILPGFDPNAKIRLLHKLRDKGTKKYLSENGIDSELVLKMHEGRPNIVDSIKNEEIQLVVNTPSGKLSADDDSYIRKSAIKHGVPYVTTIAAALASSEGIAARMKDDTDVKSLQDYHDEIKTD